MQNRLPISLGLVVALLILTAACSKENPAPLEERVKVERSLLGCSAYEEIRIAEQGDTRFYEKIVQHGRYFLYGGTTKLLITDGFGGMAIHAEASSISFDFHKFQNRLFILGLHGIYEFFEDGRLELVSNNRYYSIVNAPDGKLLVANDVYSGILELDPISFTTAPYIINFPVGESMCRSINNLHFSPDGYLWATDCDMNLLQFDGISLVGWFSAKDSDFWGEGGFAPFTQGTFFRNYGSSMIVVNKNAPGYFKVLRYEAGEWSTLFLINYLDPNPAERLPEKGLEMLRGSANDAEIVGDKLYVLTQRNIQEIDLGIGDGQAFEDAFLIKDPNLSRESGYDLYQSQDGTWYLLNTQKVAVRLGCN